MPPRARAGAHADRDRHLPLPPACLQSRAALAVARASAAELQEAEARSTAASLRARLLAVEGAARAQAEAWVETLEQAEENTRLRAELADTVGERAAAAEAELEEAAHRASAAVKRARAAEKRAESAEAAMDEMHASTAVLREQQGDVMREVLAHAAELRCELDAMQLELDAAEDHAVAAESRAAAAEARAKTRVAAAEARVRDAEGRTDAAASEAICQGVARAMACAMVLETRPDKNESGALCAVYAEKVHHDESTALEHELEELEEQALRVGSMAARLAASAHSGAGEADEEAATCGRDEHATWVTFDPRASQASNHSPRELWGNERYAHLAAEERDESEDPRAALEDLAPRMPQPLSQSVPKSPVTPEAHLMEAEEEAQVRAAPPTPPSRPPLAGVNTSSAASAYLITTVAATVPPQPPQLHGGRRGACGSMLVRQGSSSELV